MTGNKYKAPATFETFPPKIKVRSYLVTSVRDGKPYVWRCWSWMSDAGLGLSTASFESAVSQATAEVLRARMQIGAGRTGNLNAAVYRG